MARARGCDQEEEEGRAVLGFGIATRLNEEGSGMGIEHAWEGLGIDMGADRVVVVVVGEFGSRRIGKW